MDGTPASASGLGQWCTSWSCGRLSERGGAWERRIVLLPRGILGTMPSRSDLQAAQGLSPRDLRRRMRSGEWHGPTAGLVPGFAQANLVVVPRETAYDFLLFCHRNPKPCPLIDVTDPGSPEPAHAAPGADLRTDLPRYR